MKQLVLVLLFLGFAAGCSSGGGEGEVREEPGSDYTVFTHSFPEGVPDCATGDFFEPAVSYPPIPVDGRFRHLLTFRLSPMSPPSRKAIPTHGPVILYSDEMEVMVFSPLDHFFESLVTFEGGALSSGVEGEVEEIPAGFSHSFILVRGRGLNATVERWGDLLRGHYGRQRADRYADSGLAKLGYWTDNGGYYYYRTEPGLNEEDTLLAVKADADRNGIPYGYLQLDSWWYFKDAGRGGLTLWEPIPEMFPQGLQPFQERLGLPLVAHNRWFAEDNAYRDRYAFVSGDGSPPMAFPLERGVFDEFMRNAKSWGVETYEQDWLSSQYWGVPYLRQGVGRASEWMGWIDDSAADQGLTVQLCMAGPAHFLEAVRMPRVTTARTSIDYLAGTPKTMFWPQFHQVNLLAWAVGVLPFKDNFQTTPGQRPVFSETQGEQEALISILSAGMVGPSDRVGATDRELVLRTCRGDGLLLKPDRPVTPIDAMFLPHRRPYLTSTHSRREGLGQWTYLAAYHLARGDALEQALDTIFSLIFYGGVPVDDMFVIPDEISDWQVDLEADLGIQGPVVVYNWRTGLAVTDDSFSIPPLATRGDYAYFVLAPVFGNGLALIGEPDKFVTLADRRFRQVETLPDAIRVVVEGLPGERVSLLAYDARAGCRLEPVTVEIGPSGEAQATLAR